MAATRRTVLTGAAALAALAATGCARAGEDRTGDTTSPSDTAESATTGSVTPESGRTRITVTINGVDHLAHLNDSQAAGSLVELLPLDLSFRDYSAGVQEKIADLDQPLAYEEMPAADDPVPGDIAYWSPDERIVLYWGDVGQYTGIHVIGAFDNEDTIEVVQSLTEDDQVRIALAEESG